MSVHYLIDGYNAIHRIPALAGHGSLRQAREGLMRCLRTQALAGSPRNHLTVVFDGQPDISYPCVACGVHVVFTVHESADEWICNKVERASRAASLYVVSDDKALTRQARLLGAKTLKVDDFFAVLLPSSKTQKARKARISQQEDKQISAVVANQINQELAHVWLT